MPVYYPGIFASAAPHGVSKDGNAQFSSFTSTGTPYDHTHVFGSGCNALTVIVAGEIDATITISSVAIDPAGANVACSAFALTNNGIQKIWAFEAHSLSGISGSKTVRITFSASGSSQAGRVQSQSYFNAAGYPPTPVNTNQAASNTSLSVSLGGLGVNAGGILQWGITINTSSSGDVSPTGFTETDDTFVSGPGFSTQNGEKVGSLGATETPSASWTTGANRCAAIAFVVNPSTIYSPYGTVFDGTNDYLSLASAYTGAADSDKLTVAFSIMLRGTASDQNILAGAASGNARYVIGRDSSNAIYLFAQTATPTLITNINSGALSTNTWHNVLISKNGTTIQIYTDDTSNIGTTSTNSAGNIDFTGTASSVGAFTSGATKLNAELSDVWMHQGVAIDFSVTANRRLFFTSDGKVVSKGANGEYPLAGRPMLFLAGPVASWNTNLGTGGGLTVNGALTQSSEPPSGA